MLMKNSFLSVKSILLEGSDIYVVFGAGGDRDVDKRSGMAEIVEKYAKHAFITPDNPRNENQNKIASDIKMGFKSSNYTVYDDRKKGLIKLQFLHQIKMILLLFLEKEEKNTKK